MERSHLDIVYEILSHVPACSVLNCKLVCKTWKSLLSHRKVGLIFLISLHGGSDAQLYYGDYNEVNNDHGQFSHETLAKINFPPIKMGKEEPMFVGSCNGLVCISLPEHDNYFLYDPVYICNPTTGEYVNLPKLSVKNGQIASGFGYLPKTNEYKIVRVYYTVEALYSNPYIPCGKVQVYTLGSGGGGWRNLRDTTFELCMPGVAGNGVIYFMDNEKRILVTFDLADEEFRVLEQPPCFHSETCNFYEAKVLGGCLYVVHRVRGKSFELWSFEDNKNEKDTDHSGSWKKEFSIPWQGLDCRNSHDAISLTKSNQLLFWLCCRVLLCYDRNEGTVNEIASIDPGNIRTLEAIPHMSSHVSLKDLGIQSNQA